MGQEKSPLAMDAAAAAKMGLSYGKYKAIQYDRWLEEQAKAEAARAKRKAEWEAYWEQEVYRRKKAREENNFG